jgi:hypothetical protein
MSAFHPEQTFVLLCVAESYPRYTSYPQVDLRCAAGFLGPPSTCSQSGRPETEEAQGCCQSRKAMDIRKSESGNKALAGRARKKREAEAQAKAAPTFQTVQRNRSLRAKVRRKRLRRSRDVSMKTRWGPARQQCPCWKPEREPELGSQDLRTGS